MVKAPVFFPSAIKLRNVGYCQAKMFETVPFITTDGFGSAPLRVKRRKAECKRSVPLCRQAGKPKQTEAVCLQQHESRSHHNGWQDGPQKQFYR